MTFQFSIPGPRDQTTFAVDPGSSIVFVGANGGGKSRLAVHIENIFLLNAHRISAHRALSLNPDVVKISERKALTGLRIGNISEGVGIIHREGNRWKKHMATSLLNDFDFLVQALFAEQSNMSLKTHNKVRAGDASSADPTKFERLVEIWEHLLPHRKLHISGDNIEVTIPGSDARYNASEMSDGERAIFYMIGQTLAAADNSLLIFDEPELHVHRSIMGKLWDELEAVRQDCAFVYITHDLEFAATRVAQKFIVSDYNPAPNWLIEAVPENTGFGEELTTLILGSRRPILFVEGNENSLDQAIYRCCFPDWTIVPRGSCEEVIHSVVTMRRNEAFTRVTCSGIVDADGHQEDDVANLKRLGLAVLPVSEIENIILLPTVSQAIAMSDGHSGPELEGLLNTLKSDIFETLNSEAAIDAVVTRYCRRRIDRLLKQIDFCDAGTVEELTTEYNSQTSALDIVEIADQIKVRIAEAIRDNDLPKLLANYDNKGLMALAATHLKKSKLRDFESWLMRVLRNDKEPVVVEAIRKSLPFIKAE